MKEKKKFGLKGNMSLQKINYRYGRRGGKKAKRVFDGLETGSIT